MKLTDKEMEVMYVLWGSETPLSVTEIIAASEDRTWKENSIFVMMNSLLVKGAVNVPHLKPTVTKAVRTYQPTLSMEDMMARQIYYKVKYNKAPDLNFDVEVFIEAIRKLMKDE